MNLFVYGTLRNKSLVSRLLKKRLRFLDASVNGYRKEHNAYGYFSAFEDKKSLLRGKLVSGLSASDLRKLDKYEGDAYKRKRAVCIASKKKIECQLYVGVSK